MRRCTTQSFITQSFITVEEVRREKRWTPANEDSRPELVRPAAAPHCTHQPAGKARNRPISTVMTRIFAYHGLRRDHVSATTTDLSSL